MQHNEPPFFVNGAGRMSMRPSSSNASAIQPQERRETAREYAARSKAAGRQYFCSVFDGAVKLASEPRARHKYGVVKHRRAEKAAKASKAQRNTSYSRSTSVDTLCAASEPAKDCPMCKILNESLRAARTENEAVNVALRTMQAKVRRLTRHEIEERAVQSLAARDQAVASSLCARFGLDSAEHAVRRFEELERAKSANEIALAKATCQIQQLRSALAAACEPRRL